MCWVNDTAIPQIAAEDIPIFKVCDKKDDKISSYYQNYTYILNRVYTSDINVEKVKVRKYDDASANVIDAFCYRIFKGFHSYHPDCSIEDTSSEVILVTYNGYKCDSYAKDPYCVKVVGFIPKGATYYRNKYGEYVSSSIVLTNVAEKFLNERFTI